MKKWISYLAMGWGFLVFFLIIFVDFDPQMRGLIQISDYLMTFHVAGYLVAHGQTALLYPPPDAVSFAGAPFDKMAHVVLSQMPAASVAEYMYMPLSAAVFAPFSFLSPNASLFCWQILSALCMAYCSYLISKAATLGGAEFVDAGTVSWLCLMLIPVCLTLWIGQVGLVFGLLPLLGGFYLLYRDNPWHAGIAWSFAIFKPQFLVPVLVILIAQACRKRFSSAIGLAAGAAVLGIINVVAFSPAMIVEWLRCLKLSDIIYSDPKFGVATHIATSLPRTIILIIPVDQQAMFKPLIYGMAGILFLSAAFAVWRMAKRGVSEKHLLNLSLLLGVYLTPLVMPHFFFYDYCLFVAAGLIIFLMEWPVYLEWRLKSLAIMTLILINIYSIVVLAAHQFASPLLFMILMTVLYLRLVMATLKADAEGS
jgi:hypothetical protein